MNTYLAYFGTMTQPIEAESSYRAQQLAVAHFKPRKSQQHLVSVMLVEKGDGTPVVHSTAELGS